MHSQAAPATGPFPKTSSSRRPPPRSDLRSAPDAAPQSRSSVPVPFCPATSRMMVNKRLPRRLIAQKRPGDFCQDTSAAVPCPKPRTAHGDLSVHSCPARTASPHKPPRSSAYRHIQSRCARSSQNARPHRGQDAPHRAPPDISPQSPSTSAQAGVQACAVPPTIRDGPCRAPGLTARNPHPDILQILQAPEPPRAAAYHGNSRCPRR